MIDRGGGLTTAYAHLSRIEVREGDCVGEGVVIGGARSTGLSEGLKLHFEVHVQGKPVDPAPMVGDK